MSKPLLALLIGGLVPAVLFGISGVMQKTAARAGIGTGPFLVAAGAVVLLAGLAVTAAQGDATAARAGVAWAFGFGLVWATAVAGIAVALTSTVLALAGEIYEDRAFDRLPILADALQDAGCEDKDVLTHCRQPGGHSRGCWVMDVLLGKE